MTALTLLPAILLMMTSFTRIVIVLGILRQALGAGQTPPNQVLVGLSLFPSLFIMSPVIDKVNTDAREALHGRPDRIDRRARARHRAAEEIHAGPDARVRHRHLRAHLRRQGFRDAAMTCRCRMLVPAVRHERAEDRVPHRLPDLHSVRDHRPRGRERAHVDGHDDALARTHLLPFKLMLFVLVDGWSLVMGTLAASFYT